MIIVVWLCVGCVSPDTIHTNHREHIEALYRKTQKMQAEIGGSYFLINKLCDEVNKLTEANTESRD